MAVAKIIMIASLIRRRTLSVAPDSPSRIRPLSPPIILLSKKDRMLKEMERQLEIKNKLSSLIRMDSKKYLHHPISMKIRWRTQKRTIKDLQNQDNH